MLLLWSLNLSQVSQEVKNLTTQKDCKRHYNKKKTSTLTWTKSWLICSQSNLSNRRNSSWFKMKMSHCVRNWEDKRKSNAANQIRFNNWISRWLKKSKSTSVSWRRGMMHLIKCHKRLIISNRKEILTKIVYKEHWGTHCSRENNLKGLFQTKAS